MGHLSQLAVSWPEMREAIIRVKKQLRDAFMNANKQCLQAVTGRPH